MIIACANSLIRNDIHKLYYIDDAVITKTWNLHSLQEKNDSNLPNICTL